MLKGRPERLTIWMHQLQSFQRVFLVLSVAPLGLIGKVVAPLLAGKPLGFVAILGVIALIGMIARYLVILIDQIDVEIEHGRPAWETVVEGTLVRYRPIAPTVSWGPMAYMIGTWTAGWGALTARFPDCPRPPAPACLCHG